MIRAGIYVRKSSDDSDRDAEARSCERQIDDARAYAVRMGWQVVEGCVWRDDAVSGAEWRHRKAFNAMLVRLEAEAPIDVLVVAALDRIGRDPRTLAAILRVEDAGVKIHGYMAGRPVTLTEESGEVTAYVDSLVATMERRRASVRTYDALLRRFKAGAACGGAAYGYALAERPRDERGRPTSYAHYVVNAVEAAVVRRVFDLYDVQGLGLGRIAKALNDDGVKAPQGGLWSVASLGLLLRRPIYAGVRRWSQTKVSMRGGTRNQPARPTEEWLTFEAPELALVTRAQWDRVQGRIEQRGAAFLRSQGGRLIGRPRFADASSAYLLSGLLTCACCGAALGPVAPGRRAGRRAYYACSRYHRAGRAGCRNGLRLAVTALDAAVLDAVAARLDGATVAAAVRQAAGLLTAGQADTATRRATIAGELATIATRERRLLDAMADSDPAVMASIKARLGDELSRRDALAAELATLDTATPVDVAALVRDVERRAADLRGLLARHPAQARQVIRLLLGGSRWACAPYDDATGRGYRCSASGDYRRLGIKGLSGFTVGDVESGTLRPPHVPGAGSACSTRSSGVSRSAAAVRHAVAVRDHGALGKRRSPGCVQQREDVIRRRHGGGRKRGGFFAQYSIRSGSPPASAHRHASVGGVIDRVHVGHA
jgi:site-specific DNA recombinase